MSKSIKAALLSGLLFPGLGHLYLKRFLPATILIISALIAIGFVASVILVVAVDISAQIESGAIAPDMITLTETVTEQVHAKRHTTNISVLVLIVLWVFGIVDSYRIGRKQDKPAN